MGKKNKWYDDEEEQQDVIYGNDDNMVFDVNSGAIYNTSKKGMSRDIESSFMESLGSSDKNERSRKDHHQQPKRQQNEKIKFGEAPAPEQPRQPKPEKKEEYRPKKEEKKEDKAVYEKPVITDTIPAAENTKKDPVNIVRIKHDEKMERLITTDGFITSSYYIPSYQNVEQMDISEMSEDEFDTLVMDMRDLYVYRTHPAAIIDLDKFLDKVRTLGIKAVNTNQFLFCAGQTEDGNNLVYMYYIPYTEQAVLDDLLAVFNDNEVTLAIMRSLLNTRDSQHVAFQYESPDYIERYMESFDQVEASNKFLNIMLNHEDTVRSSDAADMSRQEVVTMLDMCDIKEFHCSVLDRLTDITVDYEIDEDEFEAILQGMATDLDGDDDDEESEPISQEEYDGMADALKGIGITVPQINVQNIKNEVNVTNVTAEVTNDSDDEDNPSNDQSDEELIEEQKELAEQLLDEAEGITTPAKPVETAAPAGWTVPVIDNTPNN